MLTISSLYSQSYTPSLLYSMLGIQYMIFCAITQAPTPGDNTCRQAIPTTKYLQVVIFDHVTRRKA